MMVLFRHVQVFGMSICMGHPTPGAVLMNLRYRNERGTQSAIRHAPEDASLPRPSTFLVRTPPSCCLAPSPNSP